MGSYKKRVICNNSCNMTRRGNQMSETTGSRVKNRIMKEVRGGNAPVAASNPSKVNHRPWYPLVVEMVLTAGPEDDRLVTVKELIDAVAKQLGFQPETAKELCVRLHMVRAWAAPQGGNEVDIDMATSSLIPTLATAAGGTAQYGVLNQVSDTGSVTDFAKVGYNWPIAQSDVLLTYTADFVVSDIQSSSDKVTVHYHLHWTTTGRADTPTSRKSARSS